VVDHGLVMGAVAGVLVVRLGRSISDAVYAKHLSELARSIDERQPGTRIAVLYDSLGGVDTDAKRRQQAADMFAARRSKLAASTAAFALVTDSSLMRGVLRAVFWMAPPPYPWSVRATLREGLEYLREHVPTLDVARFLAEYEQLKARALPGVG